MKKSFIIQRVRYFSSVLLVGICVSTSMAGRPVSNSAEGPDGAIVSNKDRTITGTVTSKGDGTPMPGVNVVIKGTQIGTTTDASGKYSLSISDDRKTTLVFSYIGYDSQEISVANQSIINGK